MLCRNRVEDFIGILGLSKAAHWASSGLRVADLSLRVCV